jgi:hypothetical protein
MRSLIAGREVGKKPCQQIGEDFLREKNIVISDMRAIQGQTKEKDLDTLALDSFKQTFNKEIAREQYMASNAVMAEMTALADGKTRILAGSGVSGDPYDEQEDLLWSYPSSASSSLASDKRGPGATTIQEGASEKEIREGENEDLVNSKMRSLIAEREVGNDKENRPCQQIGGDLFREKIIVIGDRRAIQGQAKVRNLVTSALESFKQSFNTEIAREQITAGMAALADGITRMLTGPGASGDSYNEQVDLLAALSETFDETAAPALSMHNFQHDGVASKARYVQRDAASKARHIQDTPRDAANSARRLQKGIADTVAHEGRDDTIEVIVKGDKDSGGSSEDFDKIEVVASSTTPGKFILQYGNGNQFDGLMNASVHRGVIEKRCKVKN